MAGISGRATERRLKARSLSAMNEEGYEFLVAQELRRISNRRANSGHTGTHGGRTDDAGQLQWHTDEPAPPAYLVMAGS